MKENEEENVRSEEKTKLFSDLGKGSERKLEGGGREWLGVEEFEGYFVFFFLEDDGDVITAEARFNSRSKMRTWVRELELLTHNNNNNTVPSDAKTGGNDCECCVSFCLHLVFWSTSAGFLRCMGLFCFVLQGLARCLNCH